MYRTDEVVFDYDAGGLAGLSLIAPLRCPLNFSEETSSIPATAFANGNINLGVSSNNCLLDLVLILLVYVLFFVIMIQ
jgi:hypothetical protein